MKPKIHIETEEKTMDGNHPKNKSTHPRRAKAKDNPYTIYTTGSDTGHPKYIRNLQTAKSGGSGLK